MLLWTEVTQHLLNNLRGWNIAACVYVKGHIAYLWPGVNGDVALEEKSHVYHTMGIELLMKLPNDVGVELAHNLPDKRPNSLQIIRYPLIYPVHV